MEKLMNLAFQKVDVEFLKGIFKSSLNKMDAKKFFKQYIESDLKTIKRVHDKYNHSGQYEELKRQAKGGSTLYIDEKLLEVKESMTEEEYKNTIWHTIDMDVVYELFIREVDGWK